MTDRHRSIRFGIFVILAALGLRTWAGRAAPPIQPNTAAVAAYTETGLKVRSFAYLFTTSQTFRTVSETVKRMSNPAKAMP